MRFLSHPKIASGIATCFLSDSGGTSYLAYVRCCRHVRRRAKNPTVTVNGVWGPSTQSPCNFVTRALRITVMVTPGDSLAGRAGRALRLKTTYCVCAEQGWLSSLGRGPGQALGFYCPAVELTRFCPPSNRTEGPSLSESLILSCRFGSLHPKKATHELTQLQPNANHLRTRIRDFLSIRAHAVIKQHIFIVVAEAD